MFSWPRQKTTKENHVVLVPPFEHSSFPVLMKFGCVLLYTTTPEDSCVNLLSPSGHISASMYVFLFLLWTISKLLPNRTHVLFPSPLEHNGILSTLMSACVPPDLKKHNGSLINVLFPSPSGQKWVTDSHMFVLCLPRFSNYEYNL